MSDSTSGELIESGLHLRDRLTEPDRRGEGPRYAVEVDRGYQAPVILGEGATPQEAFERARQRWQERPEPRRPSYEELETSLQTWQHIDQLRKLLRLMATELLARGETHDRSKFDRAEVDAFTEFTPKLKNTTYGSEEYKGYLAAMKPALDHHYGHNRHHPDFFVQGLRGMNLIDVLEMFLDWWASSRRHADGDIRKSIEINQRRFGMGETLTSIFVNTVQDFEPLLKGEI